MFSTRRLFSPKALTFMGAFGGAAAIWSGHNYIKSDEFGLQETLGIASRKILPPGFYVNWPFLIQYTHGYKLSAQRIEFNAGSCRFIPVCENTQDRNVLLADLIITYKVSPDGEKLAMRPWSMEAWGKTPGYWLVTNLANESANAIFGRNSMQATISKPEEFLRDFVENFVDRLGQNNVPVEPIRVELRNFHTSYLYPAHFVTQNSIIPSAPSPR